MQQYVVLGSVWCCTGTRPHTSSYYTQSSVGELSVIVLTPRCPRHHTEPGDSSHPVPRVQVSCPCLLIHHWRLGTARSWQHMSHHSSGQCQCQEQCTTPHPPPLTIPLIPLAWKTLRETVSPSPDNAGLQVTVVQYKT